MNNIEGQITIDLYPKEQSDDVQISSSRPLRASKLLIGKTPDQALSMIPLLFNICAVAQSRAALLAIENNTKKDSDPMLESAREMLVLAENAREHLSRIFLDWPRLFKFELRNNKLSYLAKLVNGFSLSLFVQGDAFSLNSKLNNEFKKVTQQIEILDKFLVENVFHTATESWQGYQNDKLQAWAKECNSIAANTVNIIHEKGWGSQGSNNIAALPKLDSSHLIRRFNACDADQFIANPEWQGDCFETTVLSRQLKHPLVKELDREYSSGLMTRWVARLIELASIPDQMRTLLKQIEERNISCSDLQTSDVQGIAQIETARGRLIHRVETEQGLIKQFQILAPTEWNFHPQGLLSQSLATLKNRASQELEQISQLIINAVDPCVGYQLRIH